MPSLRPPGKFLRAHPPSIWVYLNRNNPVYTQPIMIPLRLLLAIPLLAAALPAQQARWSKIDPNSPVPHTGDATLTPAQIHSIHTLFHADGQLRRPDCAASDPDHGLPTDWFKHLAYTTLARSHSSETILAEDTTNCGSPGGTSGAAPIWVIHLASVRTAIHATLLASPLIDQHVGGISGWLYRILPANSPVYPDLVLGWHMSAAETDLTWLHFDGRRYRQVSTAKAVFADDGRATITPDPKPKPDTAATP